MINHGGTEDTKDVLSNDGLEIAERIIFFLVINTILSVPSVPPWLILLRLRAFA
jgi:hypothetical protein